MSFGQALPAAVLVAAALTVPVALNGAVVMTRRMMTVAASRSH